MFKMKLRAGLKYLAIALLLPAGAGALVIFSAEPAFAERGNNNGNGNGNGNRNANRDTADRGNNNREAGANNGNNGRGAIARELKGLNAAHASATALASASPDSMPGKLNAYRETYLGAATAQQEAEDAQALYTALQNMTEDRFLALNPTLDFATTLQSAEDSYIAKSATASQTSGAVQTSLLSLTGGRTLSNDAMTELHTLLGL